MSGLHTPFTPFTGPSVILSEAKNLSSIQVQENKQSEVLRFAQNDGILSFSETSEARGNLYSLLALPYN